MGRKRDLVSKTASKIARPLSAISKTRRQKYQNSPRLVILMFHHVSNRAAASQEERDLMMTPAEFRGYCEFFKERFELYTFLEAAYLLKHGPIKKPLMVFTFDDGYTDFYETVFPILKELDIPANQNIIVKYADENRPGYLNWKQIKELKDSGLVELGCHTYDQHYLVDGKSALENLSKEEILKDLSKAEESFFEHMGCPMNVLAWPYGTKPRNISTEDLKKLGFKFWLGTTSGINFGPIEYKQLNRFAALGFESPEKLLSIIEGYDALGFVMHKN